MAAPVPDLVRDLSDPRAYPDPVPRVEVRETHVSWLFFAGERVYKVKKPVRFPFLDFSTAERRRLFCEEEVRLNRRLVQGVHLGVVPIARGPDGLHRIGGWGETVEHAVLMKRLPSDRMLDALLERGAIDNALLERLAHVLARFHGEADAGSEVAQHGTPEAVRRNVLDNLAELAPFVKGAPAPTSGSPLDLGPSLHALVPELHAFLVARAEEFLDAHGELLARRVAQGRVRDGHGDLHAENICVLAVGKLAIYDCIEFNPALRAGDVAGDVAFLLMDLEYRGYPGHAGFLARRYAQEAQDPELELLLPFYKAYRACVRAKVALLGAAEGDAKARALARVRAARYLHLAAGYDLPAAVILIAGEEEPARKVAAVLRRPLRGRVLDATGPSRSDLPEALAGERAAVLALPAEADRLEGALEDAAVRLGRPVVHIDAEQGARLDPEALAATVIRKLILAWTAP
jgi:aminoglycoside phosphotransferase family enzyme